MAAYEPPSRNKVRSARTLTHRATPGQARPPRTDFPWFEDGRHRGRGDSSAFADSDTELAPCQLAYIPIVQDDGCPSFSAAAPRGDFIELRICWTLARFCAPCGPRMARTVRSARGRRISFRRGWSPMDVYFFAAIATIVSALISVFDWLEGRRKPPVRRRGNARRRRR